MKKKLRKKIAAMSALCAVAVSGLFGSQVVSKAADVEINETNFKDSYIYSAVLGADANKDGLLSSKEASTIESLFASDETDDISWVFKYLPNVKEITVNVGNNTKLKVGNTKLTTINLYSAKNVVSLEKAAPKYVQYSVDGERSTYDFSKAKGYEKVTEFRLYGNKNTKKVVPANQGKLTKFEMYNTSVSSYNAASLKSIKTLDLSSNNLKSLNVSKNKTLTSLACYSNKLTGLNLKSNSSLHDVGAGDNSLSKLDVSNNKKIISVVAYKNKLKGVITPNNSKINRIDLSKNKVTSFVPKQYKSLETLYLADNSIKTLDISKNVKLSSLDLAGTNVKKISPAKNAKFGFISVGKNHTLLNPIKLQENNPYIYIYFDIAKGKSCDLIKLMPALNGYKFKYNDGNISVSENGVVKCLNNKTAFFYAEKGKKTISFVVNREW